MSRSTVIVLLLTGLVTLSGVCAGSDSNANQTQTPQNVIGLVDETVILECSRNVPPGEITWKYVPHGSNAEYDIPSGRYRFETSNYGVHRLILEHLQLADAGLYVCRSVSKKIDGAAAYVVVVAYGPFCYSNLTTSVQELTEGDAVKMTCVVTYASIPGVDPSLTWTQTGGNFTLSKDYTSSPTGTSFHSLTAVVKAEPPSLSQYSCKVAFHHTSKRPGDDDAQNVPDFVKGSTCVLPDRHIVVVAHHNSAAVMLTTTQKGSLDNAYKHGLVVVSVLAIIIIITLLLLSMLLYLRLRKHRRDGGVQSSAEDPMKRLEKGIQCMTETQDAATQYKPLPGTSGAQVEDEDETCSEPIAASAAATVERGSSHGQLNHRASLEHLPVSRPVSETQNNIIALEETGASHNQSEPCVDLNLRIVNEMGGTIAETDALSTSENQQQTVQSTSEQQQQQQQSTSDLQLSSQITNTATEDEIDSEASECDWLIGS